MNIANLRAGAALCLVVAASAAAAQDGPAPASEATGLEQRIALKNLPPEGTRDTADAARGFLATRKDPVILAANGKPVWNLDAYAFVTGPAPETVNPSLWRHMTHLKRHGLYEVTKNVW